MQFLSFLYKINIELLINTKGVVIAIPKAVNNCIESSLRASDASVPEKIASKITPEKKPAIKMGVMTTTAVKKGVQITDFGQRYNRAKVDPIALLIPTLNKAILIAMIRIQRSIVNSSNLPGRSEKSGSMAMVFVKMVARLLIKARTKEIFMACPICKFQDLLIAPLNEEVPVCG